MRLAFVVFAVLLFLPLNPAGALPRGETAPAAESAALKSIAAWLRQSGRDGRLAADVADAADFPRDAADAALDAKQRGFRSGGVLRIAQIPADARRDFLLFVVQRPDGEVSFYLSSVTQGLQKAFVFLPLKDAVSALAAAEAQEAFRREILYWEARVAGNG